MHACIMLNSLPLRALLPPPRPSYPPPCSFRALYQSVPWADDSLEVADKKSRYFEALDDLMGLIVQVCLAACWGGAGRRG